MTWKKKGTQKEQKKGMMKRSSKLQGVYSTQRNNKERGQNKSYPSSVFFKYMRQVPELNSSKKVYVPI